MAAVGDGLLRHSEDGGTPGTARRVDIDSVVREVCSRLARKLVKLCPVRLPKFHLLIGLVCTALMDAVD